MALLKNLTNFVSGNNTKESLNTSELQKQNTTKKSNAVRDIKAAVIKSLGLLTFTSYNREAFIAPEYNLEEIRNASEADSYIKCLL